MKTLIKNAMIIDVNSAYNCTINDMLIDNDKIVAIDKKIDIETAKVIEFDNLHVSTGWFDLKANFGDPGYEDKETLETGALAAMNGGFKTVALSPSTNPVIQSKSQIEYVVSKSKDLGIKILPLGAATINQEGKQMAEMYDMFTAGAVGFTDDKNSIQNAQLFTALLQYANNFGAKIFHYACDHHLNFKTISHEGIAATALGFKGQPPIAEDVIVARDLAISRYYNLPIHFSTISTSGAVQLIRAAKQEGIKVTCDVAAHQIYFVDEDLTGFDSNLKVLPPFRDKQHQNALIEGILDGTIDVICSDHSPQNIELKFVEFDHASYGISSIETCFYLMNTVLKNKMKLDEIVAKITIAPSKVLNQKIHVIAVGSDANLTLFNPEFKFIFDRSLLKSKSKNNPLHGKELIGKVYSTI